MPIFIVGLFILWKSYDIIISLIAPHVIPYLGFFSYGNTMLKYGMPDFIRSLTNFDGIFYIRIAITGYSYTEQAYFPLYPLLIRYLNMLIHNPIVTGVLISHVSFAIGVFFFYKYLSLLTESKYFRWALTFLFIYPTSYYFGVMYTESLFFMLLMGTLYLRSKRNWQGTFILGYLTGITRVVGVFTSVPIIITNLFDRKNKKDWRAWLVALSPLLGLASYCLYLWRTLGDPLYFIRAQESFGAHRSSHLVTPIQVIYRYFKIFLTADVSFQYVIAMVELLFFTFAVTLLIYDLYKQWQSGWKNQYRLGLAAFSWISLIIPTLTGTFTAIPRYTLMSLSIIPTLAELESKRLKIVLLTLFIIIHGLFFALFIQGHYVT